eukprot:789972-Ditylum_brightwellii.AAC.1
MKASNDTRGNLCMCVTKETKDEGDVAKKVESVIDDCIIARKTFTAKYLYGMDVCRTKTEEAEKDGEKLTKSQRGQLWKDAIKQYETEHTDVKARWEMKGGQYLERHPLIKHGIVHIMRSNSKAFWRSIAVAIDYWYSHETIRRWTSSREEYKVYTKRIIPLLSPPQKKEHLKFAKHFKNNWGLGA